MNLPNLLSLLRLSFVPIFPLVFFFGGQYANLWAAAVYALASFTDILDGYFARKLNMITKLGRLLDPVADKLMGAVVIFCIAVKTPLLWWAVGLFCLKEGLMGIGALIQYKKIADVPPSEFVGKFSAAFFFGVCLLILVFPGLPPVLMLILVGIAMLLSIVALLLYLKRFIMLTGKK